MDFRQAIQAVWEHSLDGIVIADAQTVITDINPAYCQLAGFSREELIGQKTNVIGSGLTPRAVFDEMWEQLRTEGKWVGELVNRRKDGSFWISFLSITQVTTPEGDVRYVGIARDISDRRSLEDKLREQSTRLGALLEAITSGVIMFDPSDRCVVVNGSLTQMLGSNVSDLIGCSRQELQERLGLLFGQDDLLSPTEPEGDHIFATKVPPTRYYTIRWGPVISATGAALGEIFTFRDITRETELDRMKSEFIATVSHELRTPMTSIKGALGLVLGGATGSVTSPQQDLLSIAQNNVDRLIRLINDILDLSRIESGRLEIRPVQFNINEAVLAAARELQSVCDQRNLRLQTELTPHLTPAYGDPDRIGQILVNLLGNAYKFTESGGLVTVRTERKDHELWVQVSDTGHGIPTDQLESIFERFTRSSGVASKRAGGTGLGLAIARAIVHEHGGKIWAESELGKGATFTFTLPVPPDTHA